MIIRWLGAFGRNGSLSDSFKFEFEENELEVCAEKIQQKDLTYQSTISSKVGLLWNNNAVRRVWHNDVFSIRQPHPNRKLQRKRASTDFFTHTECWVRARQIKGIVIRGKLANDALKEVCTAVLKYSVPLYRLNKDWTLSEMELVLR